MESIRHAAQTGPPTAGNIASPGHDKLKRPIGGDIHGHASAKMAKLAGHFRP